MAAIALVTMDWSPRLPKSAPRKQLAAPAREAGPLASRAAELAAAHPGKSGIVLLPTGLEAFANRVAFVRAATRTIDAQYYIWRGDMTGRMLLAELVAAADRGVRVRLLIDDNPTAGLDAMWSAANSHPMIEVRLFNPLVIRRPRVLNYLFAPLRLNRRMHNKSMTFDDAVTIVGGRNIGDEYFGARQAGLFIDLDALAIGDVVAQVARDFARYWDSAPAIAADAVLPPPAPGALAGVRDPAWPDPAAAAQYRENTASVAVPGDGDTMAELLEWADVRLVSDNPDKALDRSRRSELLLVQIAPLLASARQRLELVSGYFVPGRMGTRIIGRLAAAGVAVRVITNSYRVTDVPLVHAGYAPRRRALLECGVRLFEAMPLSHSRRRRDQRKKTRFSGGGESVHAKTFAIDGRTLFVGSFNFDPRSALLNCEMGFIVESPYLAGLLTEVLDEQLPEAAFEVSLAPHGRLRWRAGEGADAADYPVEPNTTAFQRFVLRLLSRLPIEWLL